METVARLKLESGFSSKFNTYVVKEIAKRIKRESKQIQMVISDKIKEIVRTRLVNTQEYGSIVSGKLRGELGIPEADSRIIQVVETWINGIEVKVTTGLSPFLTIDIGVIKDDYSDVLGLAASSYTYSGRRGEGNIPWLEWLLLEGDRRIINKYEFSSSIKRGSRTGMGVMIEKAKGFWQVPPEFSGTSVDNFATRALGGIEMDIDKIVKNALESRLK